MTKFFRKKVQKKCIFLQMVMEKVSVLAVR